MGIKFTDDGKSPEDDVMAVDIISKIMGNGEKDESNPKMRMGFDVPLVHESQKSMMDEMFDQRDMLKRIMKNKGSLSPKKRKGKFF